MGPKPDLIFLSIFVLGQQPPAFQPSMLTLRTTPADLPQLPTVESLIPNPMVMT